MASSYLEDARTHFSAFKGKSGIPKASHRAKVHSLAWNCDGSLLASGSADKTAIVYAIRGRLSKDGEMTGHTNTVDQVCWNPTDRHVLATASADKTVRIWDARKGGKAVQSVQTDGENINLTWSGDGRTIAVGDKNDVLSFIDTAKFRIAFKRQFPYEVNEICWHPHDVNNLLVTTGQGTIEMYRYQDGLQSLCSPLLAHTGNCICITSNPTGRFIATGGADALGCLWDVDELVCVQTYSRMEYPIRALSFSHDSQLIALGSEDSFIDIAHVQSSELVYQHPVECTLSLCWHPKLLLLAYASDSRDPGIVSLFGVPDKA